VEEYVTSIFRVEEQAKQETNIKQAGCGLHGVISQKTELLITTAVRTSNPTVYSLVVQSLGRVVNSCVIRFVREL
jgi:hypothetical protein